MAKLSRAKKDKILKTFQQANLGQEAAQGTGFRKTLFGAFKRKGAQGVLNQINKFRGANYNSFGDINGKLNNNGNLTLKGIRRGISAPEKLARDLNVPVESFDENAARAGQGEMKQYFAARTADQMVPYTRNAQDLAIGQGRFNSDISQQRGDLATSREQQLKNRALTESGEDVNQNNVLANAGTYNSPAAENLRKRLEEIQGLRSSQEDTGYKQNVNAIDTSASRTTQDYTTNKARLGEDTTMFAKERERQLQELLGTDVQAKREKFYNQKALPSSSLSFKLQ